MSPEEWLASQQSQRSPQTPPVISPEQRLATQAEPSVSELAGAVAQDTSVPEPETTLTGVGGAMTRGVAPVAAGAALGAVLGAPLAGVGAVPGAMAGAGAGALATTLGDPIVGLVNNLFGTKYTIPSQAMEDLLTRLGVAQPKTEAERIIQSASAGAAGAAGFAGVGQSVAAGAASPLLRNVGKQIAAQPAAQVAGGAGAGAASQTAQESGFGAPGQIIAGVAGGMAGARAVAPRAPIQLPSDLEEAKRQGIRVLTSDVVKPRTFAQKWLQTLGERVPIVGTGPIRQSQQEQRINAVRNLANEYGITDQQLLSKKIWEDLSYKRRADITKYKAMKDEVIDKISRAQSENAEAGQLGKLSVQQADEALRLSQGRERLVSMGMDKRVKELDKRIAELQWQSLANYQRAQALSQRPVSSTQVELPRTLRTIDAEIDRLTNLKTDELRPVINILKDWRASVQGQDLANIEMLRKQLGESFKAPELGSVRSIGEQSASSIYKALVDDMGDFIKVNGDARDYTKWKVANSRLAEMMDEVNGTVLKTVLRKGDATPEAVNQMLFSTKPSEVARLYRSLSPEGRAAARIAIINRAIEKSGGIDNISPDRFVNQVNTLGKSINIFFSDQELKNVQGLARVLELTKRATEASALPPTGVQNFYAMLGIGTGAIGGGLTGAAITTGLMGTVGAAARMYESAAVRNLLMKIPQARPGSAEEAELVKRLFAALAAQQQVPTPEEK